MEHKGDVVTLIDDEVRQNSEDSTPQASPGQEVPHELPAPPTTTTREQEDQPMDCNENRQTEHREKEAHQMTRHHLLDKSCQTESRDQTCHLLNDLSYKHLSDNYLNYLLGARDRTLPPNSPTRTTRTAGQTTTGETTLPDHTALRGTHRGKHEYQQRRWHNHSCPNEEDSQYKLNAKDHEDYLILLVLPPTTTRA